VVRIAGKLRGRYGPELGLVRIIIRDEAGQIDRADAAQYFRIDMVAAGLA
jgi:hypothetical protein